MKEPWRIKINEISPFLLKLRSAICALHNGVSDAALLWHKKHFFHENICTHIRSSTASWGFECTYTPSYLWHKTWTTPWVHLRVTSSVRGFVSIKAEGKTSADSIMCWNLYTGTIRFVRNIGEYYCNIRRTQVLQYNTVHHCEFDIFYVYQSVKGSLVYNFTVGAI